MLSSTFCSYVVLVFTLFSHRVPLAMVLQQKEWRAPRPIPLRVVVTLLVTAQAPTAWSVAGSMVGSAGVAMAMSVVAVAAAPVPAPVPVLVLVLPGGGWDVRG